ncbi:MAG TPA: chalcone isomerase family protein [Accumulibacter sp.]|nr:chalcone isomerase family protein [Accumulibacter sp.]
MPSQRDWIPLQREIRGLFAVSLSVDFPKRRSFAHKLHRTVFVFYRIRKGKTKRQTRRHSATGRTPRIQVHFIFYQTGAASASPPFPVAKPRARSISTKETPMKQLLLVIATFITLHSAYALEIGGVKFDDKARIGNAEVTINGAGIRKKAVFKVYAMALYLPEKHATADAVLNSKGAKRIAIHLLRDLSAQQFVEALQEGIASNHNEVEMAALKDRLKQLSDTLLAIGEARNGSNIVIDWQPESATRLLVNGQSKGKDIAGEDFFKALLKIWLGNKPVQDDLKLALLGK